MIDWIKIDYIGQQISTFSLCSPINIGVILVLEAIEIEREYEHNWFGLTTKRSVQSYKKGYFKLIFCKAYTIAF